MQRCCKRQGKNLDIFPSLSQADCVWRRVKTDLKIYPGLPHGFVLAIKLDAVTEYYRAMVEWASKILRDAGKSTQSSAK